MQMIGLVFHTDTPMVSQNVTPRSSNRCSTGAVRMECEIARVDPADQGPPAIPTLDVLTRALSQTGECASSRHVSTSKAVMARFRACNHSARDVVRVSAAQRSAVRAPQLSAASFIHSRSFTALTDANPSNYWRGPPTSSATRDGKCKRAHCLKRATGARHGSNQRKSAHTANFLSCKQEQSFISPPWHHQASPAPLSHSCSSSCPSWPSSSPPVRPSTSCTRSSPSRARAGSAWPAWPRPTARSRSPSSSTSRTDPGTHPARSTAQGSRSWRPFPTCACWDTSTAGA